MQNLILQILKITLQTLLIGKSNSIFDREILYLELSFTFLFFWQAFYLILSLAVF